MEGELERDCTIGEPWVGVVDAAAVAPVPSAAERRMRKKNVLRGEGRLRSRSRSARAGGPMR
jgi:hypothetical protein